jgi:hypothetical protein
MVVVWLSQGGHKATEKDLKCEASSLALHKTLKELIAKKEANAKRDGRRRREKEATRASFINIQKRALEIGESNAQSRAIEVQCQIAR